MIAPRSKPGLEKQSAYVSLYQSLSVQKKENAIESNYYLLRKEQYESNADCFVNLTKVLYDREVECLGSSNDSNKINWDLIFEIAESPDKRGLQMSAKLANQNELWESFSKWMEFLLISKDAQSVDGRMHMKKRVESLYSALLSAPEYSQMKLLKVIAKSSKNCADMAVVGLEKAELIVQLATLGGDTMINILVLAFKRLLVKAMLVPANSKEAVETYLYYSILLNDALMLKSQNLSMLHTRIAVKCSIDEAVKRIFGKLTLEDFVCFISNDKYFRKAVLKEDYPNKASYLEKVESINSERAMILNDDLKSVFLKEEHDKVSDDFFKPIAHQVLMQKGFITKSVRYPNPVSFPRINLVASSKESNGIAIFEVEDVKHWTFVRDITFIILVLGVCLFVYGMKALLSSRAFNTNEIFDFVILQKIRTSF